MDDAILEYFADQHCSRQWKGFLRAMAEEFAEQLSEPDLQALMRRIGARFARDTALPACSTLDDLQLAMGRIWIAQDWGWTLLEERPGHLHISHHCAPLAPAFGPTAERWAPAYLEGIYQEWFRQAHADEDLRVHHSQGPDAAGSMQFRLELA